MAYPNLPQATASKEARLTGRQLDRATNGAPKVRSFYTAAKKEFAIVHPYISAAEKLALEAFIDANALTSFDFTWHGDNATYTCLLADKPPEYTPHTAGRWSVVVYLVQA